MKCAFSATRVMSCTSMMPCLSHQSRMPLRLAIEIGCPPAHVALAWTRQHRAAQVIPIVGARTPQQLQENLGCLAVELSAELARPGDHVLLSPACASFDMFRGFEHRGEVFVEAVRSLPE